MIELAGSGRPAWEDDGQSADRGLLPREAFWRGHGGYPVDFSGLPPESCEMWRVLRADSALVVAPGRGSTGPDRKGEKIMAEKESSGALHNNRLTPQVCSAAPGGPSHAKRAAVMAPHQWTLQFLIAVIKEADRKGPKIGP